MLMQNPSMCSYLARYIMSKISCSDLIQHSRIFTDSCYTSQVNHDEYITPTWCLMSARLLGTKSLGTKPHIRLSDLSNEDTSGLQCCADYACSAWGLICQGGPCLREFLSCPSWGQEGHGCLAKLRKMEGLGSQRRIKKNPRIQKAMAMQGRHAFIVDFHNGNFYHKFDVVSCLSAVTLQQIIAARSSGAMTWSMPSKMDQTILPNPKQILELHCWLIMILIWLSYNA